MRRAGDEQLIEGRPSARGRLLVQALRERKKQRTDDVRCPSPLVISTRGMRCEGVLDFAVAHHNLVAGSKIPENDYLF